MRLCSIDGCNRPYHARSWCQLHYERWKRLGDPLSTTLREICSIEGCEGKHLAKGFCSLHYHRLKRHGDPHIKSEKKSTDIERFILSYKKNNETNCFEWIKSINDSGYGMFTYNKKRLRAHRFIYEITNGKIPEKMFICHRCDNPLCANIDRLFLGTPMDNVKDMWSKNREFTPLGEHNGKSKLLTKEVIAIKKLLALKNPSPKIAKMFGVSKDAIMDIRNGVTWSHVSINEE